jgi:hypothetical protein
MASLKKKSIREIKKHRNHKKNHLAVHSSMAALFSSFGHGLLVFLAGGFVEHWEKMYCLYFVPKKVFV